MTKTTTDKTTAAKAKAKSKKPEQLKIAGTERSDRIIAIEKADEDYRESRDAIEELKAEEKAARDNLSKVMRKANVTVYVYEGKDGTLHRVSLPLDNVKAKSTVVKQPAAKSEAKADE